MSAVSELEARLKERADQKMKAEVSSAFEQFERFVRDSNLYFTRVPIKGPGGPSWPGGLSATAAEVLKDMRDTFLASPELLARYERNEVHGFLAAVDDFAKQVEYLKAQVQEE